MRQQQQEDYKRTDFLERIRLVALECVEIKMFPHTKPQKTLPLSLILLLYIPQLVVLDSSLSTVAITHP